MPLLHVERVGGLGGFGGPRSRIRSHGQLDTAALSIAEQNAVEALFRRSAKPSHPPMPDEFRYKISRETPQGIQVIEAPESAIPASLAQCVKDELA